MRYRLGLLFALSTAACGGQPEPVVPASPPPAQLPAPATPATAAQAPAGETTRKVDADTPMTTPSGATFTAPKGWTVTTRGGIVALTDPNNEVSITFVERREPDARAAIAAAWREVQPNFARKVKLAQTRPARGGWDAVEEIDYETTVAESRYVWARGRRKGDTWYVALFDGTSSGWGRRFAQMRIASESFKAKGVVEESFQGKQARELDEGRLRDLEAFLEEARVTARVPGAAVAIVRGGKVIYEKGFGVRAVGKKDPVTPATLFRIASMTKPLTSLLVATIVDEGKFTWDTPVTEIYPKFAVGDPELTKRFTMKVILCACTGIPYDNVGTTFEHAGVKAETMLERLTQLKPTTGFRETYQYSNPLLGAAGDIAAHALDPKKPMDAAYEQAMKARVLGPLGMKATTFHTAAARRVEHAAPHSWTLKREAVPIPYTEEEWISTMAPAGAAWSNVRDMARYLLMELGKGKTPEGKQIVSEKRLLERREPQAKGSDKSSYALALGVEDYRGVQVIGHSGGLWGYASTMFFLPEHDIGAVILSNGGFPNPFVYSAFRRKLFELLFDGRDEAREDLAFALKSYDEELQKEASKIDPEPDRAWIEKLVGTYSSADYGKMTIRIEGNRGVLDVGEWKGTIGRKREEDGSIKLVLTNAPYTRWPDFVIQEAGGKVVLTLEDGQRKVVFERGLPGK